ncbi:MAG: radical SAM protein [Anaerolineales bacterium]|nr:radical SAM protein [Anaerolineales bacterium]
MRSAEFFLLADDFEPAYLHLYETGELAERVEEAIASLENCHGCPRECGTNRLAGFSGTCKTGKHAIVSSAFPHMGEENCLRGRFGSGTIFFSGCSLRCVFCQNYEISHTSLGSEVTTSELAEMMLSLQKSGCHNINLVTPDHIIPQILAALEVAIGKGLRLPIVYNTSGFTSMPSLGWLDGVIDIYMPDFKTSDSNHAKTYLQAKEYPAVAEKAIREMHRQVGDLKLDQQGIAKRGLLVRHLVMPEDVSGTKVVMEKLAQISPDTFINIMGQYRPYGKVGSDDRYSLIGRRPTRSEITQAYQYARQAGLWRFDHP